MRKIFYFLLVGFGAVFSDDTDYPEVDIFLVFDMFQYQYPSMLEMDKIKINDYIDF